MTRVRKRSFEEANIDSICHTLLIFSVVNNYMRFLRGNCLVFTQGDGKFK